MAYEGWRSTGTLERHVTIDIKDREYDLHLTFEPEDALFVKVTSMGEVDITAARIGKDEKTKGRQDEKKGREEDKASFLPFDF